MEEHYVYIVECADLSFYTGYTTNVERRVAVHNIGKGARYTRSRLPVKLLAYWSLPTKTEALRVEHRIKQLSRQKKEDLLAAAIAQNPGIKDSGLPSAEATLPSSEFCLHSLTKRWRVSTP